MNCPVCNSNSDFQPETWETYFQINYALEDAIKVIVDLNQKVQKTGESICLIHNLPMKKICMNPKCTQKALNCTRCKFVNHNTCALEYLLDIQEAKEVINYIPESNYSSLRTSQDQIILKFRNILVASIDRIFENFKTDLRSRTQLMEVNQFLNNRSQYDIYISDGYKVKTATKISQSKLIYKIEEVYKYGNIEEMLRNALLEENLIALQSALKEYSDKFI